MSTQREHILFLTGRLALKRLERVLEEMPDKPFDHSIRNVGVSVAALMTAKMLERRLRPEELRHVDRILVPGLCRGDLQALSQMLGVACERGPVEVKELPVFFGGKGKEPDLSRHQVRLFAEITDAPLLSVERCLAKAKEFREAGADVIDVGCLPDTPFPHLEDVLRALRAEGYATSVDSLEEEMLLRGGKAGADYLLSLKESTLWIADEVESVPVLIPEPHADMPSLFRAVERLRAQGRDHYADPILDPIHFGFVESVLRYRELRQRDPDVPIMMGTGNVTELTEADTTGITAVLFGMISELDIQAALLTQVSPHCRSVIRESDLARRVMHAAKQEGSLPKGLHGGLLGMHHRRPFSWTEEEIREMAEQVKDPGYRVQLSERGIHVYNRDGMAHGTEPFALFPELGSLQEDAPHAFYMGVELGRAQIAWQLGKPYMQDEELNWGVCVPPAEEGQREARSQAAHDMREFRKMNQEHKAAGSTLRASRRRRKEARGKGGTQGQDG